ncbi:MAG: B12-binding domain-containing radical SAM protein [Candidatus Omnitrophica bacterium]|nr:B12-binding domain-containing radical SAM protein [Candidatus Omnitrophota bacterium]MCM8824478.1 B12-binding domain-containing radical SAM protein [Candidatus Omnitrophota bacterium]MCM8826280.1 B12-binding domain-containing radical SAM protein [Candidatus Omnitrophota bacterium]
MKILIINPPIRLNDKPRHIPHGLAILANIIRKRLNLSPIFMDINAYRYDREEVNNIIKNTEFDIVLIGGIASTYKYILELSKFIKLTNPEAKIIVGGYVAIPIPEVILKNSPIDIVCTGEGEITIENLMKKLNKNLDAPLDDIRGICYKDKDNKIIFNPPQPLISNLDEESDLPAYDLLPMEIYLSNPVAGIGRDIDFISSRGCPYRCSFCYQPWGHKPRYHSINFIVNAIEYLKNNYSIDFVSFQDDEFMSEVKRVYEFCRARNKFFPDLLWSCTGRVNIVSRNEELVKLMRESGCTLISFGFESGSQRMLDSMHKLQTIEMMEKTLKICRKYGLPVPVSFIIGMPEEDEESCKETLDFCIRNNIPLDSLMFATPYPGTEIFNFALKTKRINKDNLNEFLNKLGDARDFTINLTDCFTDGELINKRKEMMEIARSNYKKFITDEEIKGKMLNLFGSLLTKIKLDEKDLEHRLIHGGMSIF